MVLVSPAARIPILNLYSKQRPCLHKVPMHACRRELSIIFAISFLTTATNCNGRRPHSSIKRRKIKSYDCFSSCQITGVRNNLCVDGLHATEQENQEPKNIFQMADSVHVTNGTYLPDIPYMLLFFSKTDALLWQSLGSWSQLMSSMAFFLGHLN